MARTRSSLKDAMKSAASNDTNSPPEQNDVQNINSTQPPSRKGKKLIGGHFDPVVAKQLKMIGVEEDKTVQELVAEGLNYIFEKYGKNPIA